MVDVILLERVEKLGQMGQVVKVRPGFARNYLLPKKKALRATKENLAYFEKQRTQLEAQNLSRRSEAEQVAKKLEGLSVVVIRQAGESGQLYGSVTARDIADAVTAGGFTVMRAQIVLDKAIKTLGIYKQRIVLHPEVSVAIQVNVAQSAEEAEMQTKGIDPIRLAQEAAAREAAAAAETAEEPAEEASRPETGEPAAATEKPAKRARGEKPARGEKEKPARGEKSARTAKPAEDEKPADNEKSKRRRSKADR